MLPSLQASQDEISLLHICPLLGDQCVEISFLSDVGTERRSYVDAKAAEGMAAQELVHPDRSLKTLWLAKVEGRADPSV